MALPDGLADARPLACHHRVSKRGRAEKAGDDWKKYLAREHSISWQRDFFDHRLRDHHEEAEKMNYILMNPVRKGLCERAEDWAWIYRPEDRPPSRLGS